MILVVVFTVVLLRLLLEELSVFKKGVQRNFWVDLLSFATASGIVYIGSRQNVGGLNLPEVFELVWLASAVGSAYYLVILFAWIHASILMRTRPSNVLDNRPDRNGYVNIRAVAGPLGMQNQYVSHYLWGTGSYPEIADGLRIDDKEAKKDGNYHAIKIHEGDVLTLVKRIAEKRGGKVSTDSTGKIVVTYE